ncbi:thermonuclease family protein [Microvirga lotononidis]|uniref:Micrococcal nuclease-like nuclease n=1 Tax=Microvirga lotononidis TaxID=864069 RepID=I4YRU0_9HYPH|nr:thermonuclease family protein [Microvirga lotononidis]EIM26682.1 micrococcal nuclease-like nuclease [Microvirga lotononidis]WQO32088.1 thermonuclease family protein [Microvirga lotononidis]
MRTMPRRAAFLLLSSLCLALLPMAGTHAETIDGRRVVIIDGDTIALGRERLLNVDTPETFRPRCDADLVAGLRAKERLAELLRAGPVGIDRHGEDRYRRTLARLSAGGRDVGEILIAEGLALPWRDGRAAWEERRRHWCGQR